MTQKQFYESPSAELLVVRFEENIMSTVGVSSFGDTTAAEQDLSDENWW